MVYLVDSSVPWGLCLSAIAYLLYHSSGRYDLAFAKYGQKQNPKIASMSVFVYAQFCLTLHKPMDYSSSDSSVHGNFQARILVWTAIASSRGSSLPKD